MPRAEVPAPFEPIAAGMYRARIFAINDVLDGPYAPSWRWEFELVDYPDRDPIWRFTSPKLSESANAGKWIRALRFELVPRQQFDTDVLVGIECVIAVEVKAREDGSTTNKVTDVLPADGIHAELLAARKPTASVVAPTEAV